jgi:mono/diheme cytochrome c family protein
VVRVVFAALPVLTAGCSWLTDFRQQPSVGPWQSLDVNWNDTTTPFRGQPSGSVSLAGRTVPGYQVSYSNAIAVIDSFAAIANPIPATQESVDRGWKYFQVNCAVCHGEGGAGNGLALRFGVPAPSLLTAQTVARTDGYIFGMMRNGRNFMPSFNRIDELDRWHVVNYVRGLQGRLAGDITVRKEAVAPPGVTGDALPGPTRLAPTVPVPFAKPVFTPTGGSGAAAQEKHR